MKLTDEDIFDELWSFLANHVTPERKKRFEEVVSTRTRFLTVIIEDLYIIENQHEYRINPDIVLGSSNWLTLTQWNAEQHNTTNCIQHLKSQGYTIAATTLHDESIALPDFQITKKTALVFGNEVEGISDIVKQNADVFLKIPMYGFTESFNISVSAAICLSTICSKLRQSTMQWQLTTLEQRELLLEWIALHLKNSSYMIDRFLSSRG
jgi:tRNA (guanosine-2'-O-)-methyltransferase